ncbi:hypothetical protein MN116_003809 [Schistosoma mekongi]|uniref:Uncharacterized protein n=1 Tax=Schistosoma mekongi TaxID=38744 RepID=A0AAE2D622_SCHME|nr:hypothetical protein MN116_003809 [Schistosoma mekongi]
MTTNATNALQLGLVLPDERLILADYEKQASENTISQMKKQIYESKLKCEKISLNSESHELSTSDKNVENMTNFQKKVNGICQTNAPNNVKQSNAIIKLQQRLENLEMIMFKVSEEKSNLRSQNVQLTDLLQRLTEQNHRLTEELDSHIMESTRFTKPENCLFQSSTENIAEFKHDSYCQYSNEQVKMNHDNEDNGNNVNVLDKGKFAPDYHEVENFKREKQANRSCGTNEILNLPNRTLVTTSPTQPNKTNTLLYHPENSFKSNTTRTCSSVIDSSTLLACESNETSDGFFSQETKGNKNYNNFSKSNTGDKYLKNEQDFKSDTKLLDQLISSIHNVNARITVNNYKTFLNFDYQTNKDNTPKRGAQYGDKMDVIKSVSIPPAVELTSHNNSNNKIINLTSEICRKSVETDNKITIYPVDILHAT